MSVYIQSQYVTNTLNFGSWVPQKIRFFFSLGGAVFLTGSANLQYVLALL